MTDLYRMYNRRGQLLYVGVSFNAGSRATQHAMDKPWWPEVATIKVEHLSCGREDALALEKRTIQSDRPMYNKQHAIPEDIYQPPSIDIRPFAVPMELARTDAWQALQRALGDVADLFAAWGLPTLGAGALGRVNPLELIEHQARAAHLPGRCDCGGRRVAHGIRIDHRSTAQKPIQINSECHDCLTGDARMYTIEETK